VGTRTYGPERLARQPARQRDGGEHRVPGVRGRHLPPLLDVVVAADHVGHGAARPRGEGAEVVPVLAPELAAARRAVGQLAAGLRVEAHPGEVGEGARVVEVARPRQLGLQVDEREARVHGEQPVGKEERARRPLEQAHGEPARAGRRLVAEPGVEEVGEVRRRDARREVVAGPRERLVVVAGEHAHRRRVVGEQLEHAGEHLEAVAAVVEQVAEEDEAR
jgi:hypothetical protein